MLGPRRCVTRKIALFFWSVMVAFQGGQSTVVVLTALCILIRPHPLWTWVKVFQTEYRKVCSSLQSVCTLLQVPNVRSFRCTHDPCSSIRERPNG